MYAILVGNQIAEFPILNLHQRFPNTSFPLNISDSDLPSGVVRVHFVAAPNYNPQTQKLVPDTEPSFQSGRWEMGYSVASLSAQEQQYKNDDTAKAIRAERNKLLAESDWTQLADSQVDKAIWAQYRQALRDVPAQAGFPFNITWPVKPAA